MLTEAEAEKHPLRNVITRALGGALQVTPDASEIEAQAGRRLPPLLRRPHWHGSRRRDPPLVTESDDDLEKACQALIDTANERGGLDNITAILVRRLVTMHIRIDYCGV